MRAVHSECWHPVCRVYLYIKFIYIIIYMYIPNPKPRLCWTCVAEGRLDPRTLHTADGKATRALQIKTNYQVRRPARARSALTAISVTLRYR